MADADLRAQQCREVAQWCRLQKKPFSFDQAASVFPELPRLTVRRGLDVATSYGWAVKNSTTGLFYPVNDVPADCPW